jgi:hypothetical protein
MADRIPPAEIVHSIPGRTRLRIADRAGENSFFAGLADGLAALEGVRSVRTRPLIGTVLVTHDGSFAPLAIRAEAADLFVIEERGQLAAAAPPSAAALPAAGALAMVALGVFQLFQERLLPPALTLFWYAHSLAREAQATDRHDAGGDAE